LFEGNVDGTQSGTSVKAAVVKLWISQTIFGWLKKNNVMVTNISVFSGSPVGGLKLVDVPTFLSFTMSLPPAVVPSEIIYPGTPVTDSQVIGELTGTEIAPSVGFNNKGHSCAIDFKLVKNKATKSMGKANSWGNRMSHISFIAFL
tara:strand:- start:934 stop:1371 length:438 start_codon:yes stop_codon:yes gene_type:complete